MAGDILDMHRAFLTEIADRRQRLESELKRLAAVEEYHREAIASLKPAKDADHVNGAAGVEEVAVKDVRLVGASRSDACELALKELGGHAKTQQIADWLVERGYGTEFEKRIFHNTCYTAMKRKSSFRQVGPGEWRLTE